MKLIFIFLETSYDGFKSKGHDLYRIYVPFGVIPRIGDLIELHPSYKLSEFLFEDETLAYLKVDSVCYSRRGIQIFLIDEDIHITPEELIELIEKNN